MAAGIGIQEMYNALFYSGGFLSRILCHVACCGSCGGCCLPPCSCYNRCRVSSTYMTWMCHFERWLRKERGDSAENKVVFLVGGRLSYVDICLFDVIQAIEEVGWFAAEDRRAAYPLLTLLYEHVANIPAIRAYMAAREPRFK